MLIKSIIQWQQWILQTSSGPVDMMFTNITIITADHITFILICWSQLPYICYHYMTFILRQRQISSPIGSAENCGDFIGWLDSPTRSRIRQSLQGFWHIWLEFSKTRKYKQKEHMPYPVSAWRALLCAMIIVIFNTFLRVLFISRIQHWVVHTQR